MKPIVLVKLSVCVKEVGLGVKRKERVTGSERMLKRMSRNRDWKNDQIKCC